MTPAEHAAPGRNGTAKGDPVANFRAFLTTAAPDLAGAFTEAIQATEAENRPVSLGDLVLTLLNAPTIRDRLPRNRVKSAVRTFDENRAQWTAHGRRPFGFDLDAIIRRFRDDPEPPNAVAFLVAALKSGAALTDPHSQFVCGVLRDQKITAEYLLNPPCPVPGTDLTQHARECGAPPPRAVESVVRRMVAALQAGQFVALLGEVGVGKSHLIKLLARHIVGKTVPLVDGEVARWRLYRVTRGDLLGGRSAQPDRQLRRLFSYAATNRDLVLVFDDAHALFADALFGPAFVAALRAACGTGARIILVTNTTDYGRYVRTDDALHTRLTVLDVKEPDPEDAAARLKAGRADLLPDGASAAGLVLEDAAIDRAVQLTAEFVPGERNPRKSASVISAAAAERYYCARRGDGRTGVTADDVTAAFAERTGIPREDLSANPEERYARLAAELGARVRGQSRAITGVVNHLCERAKGNGDLGVPRGRFLFLGTPGCGKTELAKQLAALLYRDPAAHWVQNFGALQGSAAVYAVRGAPPGHIGYGDPTVLTHIETRPHSIVLFDELDKAPRETAGSLLDIFDGRATDSRSRVVNTSGAVICCTTNALQDWAAPEMDEADVRHRLVRSGGVFTPPLVDRFDAVFVFEPLTEDSLVQILDDLFRRRRRTMRRQVPDELWTEKVKRALVRRASHGDRASSVRRLERELTRFLAGQS